MATQRHLTDADFPKMRISTPEPGCNESNILMGKYALPEFIALITALMTAPENSTPKKETPFTHGLRRFLSVHTAYCGGYLLLQLGAAQRLWNIPRTSEKGDAPNDEVSIRIDLIEDDLIDMTVSVPVPGALPMPARIYDDRYACGERAIYFILRRV